MRKIQFKHFLQINKNRKKNIKNASNEIKPYRYIPNEIAAVYHPKNQFVQIVNIEQITDDIKRFTVKPIFNNELAPFKAGEYINVKYKIGSILTTRPYSLCSTFKQSLENYYLFSIKKVPNGLCSNYAFEHFQVGTELELSSPNGTFTYQPLRDEKNVIGIAGGAGITPFLSFASSIQEGSEDFNLTLFYGARKQSDLAFKDELDELCKNPKIKVIYCLSEDDQKIDNLENIEYGFINQALIQKYTDMSLSYSYFVCGPKAMYDYINQELDAMHIDLKHRRCEIPGEATSIHNFKDAPDSLPDKASIKVTIWDETKEIIADPTKTILRNLEENGIATLSQCRSGVCGYCHSSLIKGSVFIPKEIDHLRMADRIYNQIHICSTYPISDIEIIIAK